MDESIRRFPIDALYNAGAAFIPVAVTLVSTPVIVSRLGAEMFGLYLVSLSLAGFAGQLHLGLGVAIVVHAPPAATTSRLALEEGWGLAVSEASISAVVKAIEALAGDAELRLRRVEFSDSIRSARPAARSA